MIDLKIKEEDQTYKQRSLKPFELSQTPSAGVIEDLYRILANQRFFPSYSSAISAVLKLGCGQFKCQQGFVLRSISDHIYEIHACCDSSEQFFIGQHVSASSLDQLLVDDDFRAVIVTDRQALTTNSPNLAYNIDESRACVGVNLELSDSERGIVCFISSVALESELDDRDMTLLELMAEGIACMTDLQKARVQRKTDDLAIFASGSMKSLDEYQVLAELPEGLGISGKVVDVLKRRIGVASLSIDSIAEELNLSKRTLQRRLQQQGISFAELRDRVRFHFSIDFLVKQQISIDRISSTLDFSDRTSFTNAFKRWTGLSPSTFRKVFRDYV